MSDIEFSPEELSILAGAPGYCRAISGPDANEPTLRFMCKRVAGHYGEHRGFELPVVTLDEEVQ